MTGSQEPYEKLLLANLQRTLDFLRFAEAKNAALVALGSGWFVASLNLECSGKPLPIGFGHAILIAMLLALGAVAVALLSFLPRLQVSGFLGGRRAGPHAPNLLYFGDLATIPINSLDSELRNRYFSDAISLSDTYYKDLTIQLSINSDIAKRKMLLFRAGVCIMASASLVLLIPVAILIFRSF